MNLYDPKTHRNKTQATRISVEKENRPVSQFVDNRPEAIAQTKLQEAMNNSPRVNQLKAYQKMGYSAHIERNGQSVLTQMKATPIPYLKNSVSDNHVIQRVGEGDSANLYRKHTSKPPGESKWDNNDARKEQIWNRMNRDIYQAETINFLGFGEAPTPTTHHILNKAALPQFEFNTGNLRFGPNVGLRADDPAQAPDYNMDYDGQLTPRSVRIAEAFQTGVPDVLSKEFAELDKDNNFTYGERDFNQWFISREHWDGVAGSWKGKDTFWDDHHEDYLHRDYTKLISEGEQGNAVPGIPWPKTREIPKDDKEKKFKDVKKFLSRGSLIQNPEQKEVVTLFNKVKGHNILEVLSELDISGDYDEAIKMKQNEYIPLQKETEKELETVVKEMTKDLDAMPFKGPDAKSELDSSYGQILASLESKVAEIWEKCLTVREARNKKTVDDNLNKLYRTSLAVQENVWLQEFKNEKQERGEPYDKSDDDRRNHLMAGTKSELYQFLVSRKSETIKEDISTIADSIKPQILEHCGKLLSDKKDEVDKKIQDWMESSKKPYLLSDIKEKLTSYGVDPLRRGGQQKGFKLPPDFLHEAEAWLNGTWIDSFRKSAPARESNRDLHGLITFLKKSVAGGE